MIELQGSVKQLKWGIAVRDNLVAQYGDSIPGINIAAASFWISARNVKSLEELAELADQHRGTIYTPFTSTFPRYGHEDAIAAVKALGSDYAVLDLETTGLKRNLDEITEIAIVHANGETLIDTLVKPSNQSQLLKAIEKGISKITLEELSTAPAFEVIAPQVTDILNSHHIVIYNSVFDAPFLSYMYFKNAMEPPTIRATCAMRIASAYFGTDTNLNLKTVCELLGVEQEQAHRARSDCMSTLGILNAMLSEHTEQRIAS